MQWLGRKSTDIPCPGKVAMLRANKAKSCHRHFSERQLGDLDALQDLVTDHVDDELRLCRRIVLVKSNDALVGGSTLIILI